MCRAENLTTDPGSKLRGASFFKHRSNIQTDVYMPKMGRTENLNTDPGSNFRGASFLKHQSKFQNDVYMPKTGRTENCNTDPGSKFRGAFLFFVKMSLFYKIVFHKKN